MKSYELRATEIPDRLRDLARDDYTVHAHLSAYLAGHMPMQDMLLLLVDRLVVEKKHYFDQILQKEMLRPPSQIVVSAAATSESEAEKSAVHAGIAQERGK